jgi:hypothetical protein
MIRRSILWPLCAIALAVACADSEPAEPPTTTPAITAPGLEASGARRDGHFRQLLGLVAITAPYHNTVKARAAGFDGTGEPCVASPDGGMGYHWVNGPRVDGQVQWDQPEVLVFMPSPDASDGVRLGAVEYVVPMAAWAGETPPTLFGQTFVPGGPGGVLWTLHVWIWQHNPSGMFAPWNPTVSCGG